ncbi:MAG: hypothetical protein H7263_08995, partial [Candidatus Sericytochromatia bacterium]|nr:hypothetical protein [Candidatus Sericytochromatia bacterium]
SVAMDSAGDFVIAWDSNEFKYSGIYDKRYNSSGVAQGDPSFVTVN